jgi:hypothetical protein
VRAGRHLAEEAAVRTRARRPPGSPPTPPLRQVATTVTSMSR